MLVINPARDRAFSAAAEALLDDGPRSLSRFQEALRVTFPNAVVRARDLSGEVGEVWYVFRDGLWVNGQEGDHPVADLVGRSAPGLRAGREPRDKADATGPQGSMPRDPPHRD